MVNLEAVRRRLTTENADLLSQLQACGFETGHFWSFNLSKVIIETKYWIENIGSEIPVSGAASLCQLAGAGQVRAVVWTGGAEGGG